GNAGSRVVEFAAQVGDSADLEPDDFAVGGRRRLDVVNLSATVDHVQKILAPLFDPADWAVKGDAEIRGQHLLGRELDRGAKTATDVGRNNPHVVFVHPQNACQLGAQAMRELRTGP